ncbi:MAG: ACT domain-containing protein [Deferribacteraceae bacterium]|jgi:hypothetical protein|nr:ACT domain-containing protein [Deferribacteraceae bacterium]
MKIRQISVFIENKSGRLYEVIRLLGGNNINVRAMSLADTTDFGIARFIVNEPDEAYRLLKDNDFTAGMNDVVAISVPDKPGGLAGILHVLQQKNINIEYMYAFVNQSGDNAIMIFRFDDTDLALSALKGARFDIINEKSLFNI